MRVFFDASVIIAALLSPSGGSAETLRFAKLGIIKAVTSETVVREVLEEDHFQKIKKSKREVEKFITQSGLIIRRAITEEEIELYKDMIDPDDAHLIAGANLTKCDYLVSLDKKHVLRADIKVRFLPLRIVSPKDLLESLVAKN